MGDGAGDSAFLAAANRRRGQLGHRPGVVAEGPVGDRAVKGGDVGDRRQVQVEPVLLERFPRLQSPGLGGRGVERLADLELALTRRQVGEGAVVATLLLDRDQRPDPPPARARGAELGGERLAGARARPIPRGDQDAAQLSLVQLGLCLAGVLKPTSSTWSTLSRGLICPRAFLMAGERCAGVDWSRSSRIRSGAGPTPPRPRSRRRLPRPGRSGATAYPSAREGARPEAASAAAERPLPGSAAPGARALRVARPGARAGGRRPWRDRAQG